MHEPISTYPRTRGCSRDPSAGIVGLCGAWRGRVALRPPGPREVLGPVELWGVLLFLGVVAALGLAGCAVDGAKADCPPMPITDDPFDPALTTWREAAEEKGCVTARGDSLSDGNSEP